MSTSASDHWLNLPEQWVFAKWCTCRKLLPVKDATLNYEDPADRASNRQWEDSSTDYLSLVYLMQWERGPHVSHMQNEVVKVPQWRPANIIFVYQIQYISSAIKWTTKTNHTLICTNYLLTLPSFPLATN